MADSIARQFARWTANLKYEDLPPVVVDKMKSVLLVELVSGVLGAQDHRAKEVNDFIVREEGKADGATIIWDGRKASRAGAAFANAEAMHVTGLEDQFRMITHPGSSLIPVAITNGELEGVNMKTLLTALAAGYEVGCRLSDDFVPATAARGYRPAPIYHTMGSSVVAAKLMGLNEDGMMSAIAIGANSAAGLFESGRGAGGGETAFHDPNAARAGTFAAMVAREGHIKGSELVIEGEAGFLNAFTGNNRGDLTYMFEEPRHVDVSKIPAGLGKEWKLLNIMYRMYNTGGYNHPVINLLAELREQHKINPDEVAHVEVQINYLETTYPSAQFPAQPANPARVGSTHYFAAHAIVNGGFPQIGGRTYGPTEDPTKDEKVLKFMAEKVKITGIWNQPMFSPRAIVTMNSGMSYTGDYPYARMCWDLEGLVDHLHDLEAKFPLGAAGLNKIIDACRNLESLSSVADLHALTRAQ